MIVDSCIWFALFNKSDGNHKKALDIIKFIKYHNLNIMCPWPILYEALNTRFVRNKVWPMKLKKMLVDSELIDDHLYREQALKDVLDSDNVSTGQRHISLVDMVIRYILSDEKIHNINYLATFNIDDFIDICKERKISILHYKIGPSYSSR
ncbi:MAG: hypothetical protein HQL04_05095 [Nitrospirae bacterium]|nr:hypothetical protein [Nitrospirota bacterium]